MIGRRVIAAGAAGAVMLLAAGRRPGRRAGGRGTGDQGAIGYVGACAFSSRRG